MVNYATLSSIVILVGESHPVVNALVSINLATAFFWWQGSSAAAAAFEMMKTTIDGALDTCGEAKCVDMTAAVGTKPSLTATRVGQRSSDGSHDDDGDDLLLARKR